MTNSINKSKGTLRLRDITKRFGIARSAWWAGVAEGRFPPSLKLAPRTTAWRLCDLEELEALLAEGKDWHDHKASV